MYSVQSWTLLSNTVRGSRLYFNDKTQDVYVSFNAVKIFGYTLPRNIFEMTLNRLVWFMNLW